PRYLFLCYSRRRHTRSKRDWSSDVCSSDLNAVASNTAVASIPASLKILGFTANIYAIVINVVIPAIISVFTLVLFSFNLNNFSNITSSFLISIPHNRIIRKYIFYIDNFEKYSILLRKRLQYQLHSFLNILSHLNRLTLLNKLFLQQLLQAAPIIQLLL